MLFLHLRQRLLQKPSKTSFVSICQLFDEWAEKTEKQEVGAALSYAAQHLRDWPHEFCCATDIKWNRKLPVWWPLIRTYTHYCNRSHLPKRWVKSPALVENIRILDCSFCTFLERLDGIESFLKLEELILKGCSDLTNYDKFLDIPTLRRLSLFSSKNIRSINQLKSLQLTHLDLSHCQQLHNLEGIEHLRGLQQLKLHGCENLNGVRSLAELPELSYLDLRSCNLLPKRPEIVHMTERKDVVMFQKSIR